MIAPGNFGSFNLNPLNTEIKEGISLITAVKNRKESFKEALKTWVAFEEIDEIIIVDWNIPRLKISLELN